jgi:hypothetical protein
MIFTIFSKKLVRFCQIEKYGNIKVKEYFDKDGQELQSVIVREKQYIVALELQGSIPAKHSFEKNDFKV